MRHGVFYNEFNPESAAMIRQFMEDGLIPGGVVDERSITEIEPDELKRYTQCHFFAGIAGWTFALQLAGWNPDRNVWTGSCPCQPFSSAGRQRGKKDHRHLWPVWERLIRECKPSTVYGEQVASAIAHGWLDDVYQGLEAAGYAVGSAVLPAVCVGAPHRRERLWFVAHRQGGRSGRTSGELQREVRGPSIDDSRKPIGTSEVRAMGHYIGERDRAESGGLQGSEDREASEREMEAQRHDFHKPVKSGPLHNSFRVGHKRQGGLQFASDPAEIEEGEADQLINVSAPWSTGVWIDCLDGKKRLVEPGIQPLVDGFQHRRPILHAGGNAIVLQVAATFIKATMREGGISNG